MQLIDLQTHATETDSPYSDNRSGVDMPNPGPESSSSFIDPLELEALALILEHSLKVHTTHHFFCWTHGLLQNLIRHEVLICALRSGASSNFQVDSFSSTTGEPAVINSLFSQDTLLVPQLIKDWEENDFRPVFLDLAQSDMAVNSPLGRELTRMGATEVFAHGTYDTFGWPVSFFIFGCPPGSIEPRHHPLAALLVPSLHAAWVHTQFSRQAPLWQTGGHAGGSDLLTAREQEILGWIYRGKSNIEIGMILGISPLTVKNHVQKILRRLDVLNRAQAVGKALALRILDG